MCSISVPLKRPIFHDYVICTTRWQSSLDMSKITMKKVLVRKMVKKEEMSNNIKTKYTVQMKYANEG